MSNFRYLTSGESHGKCLTAIIEGLPAGLFIDEEFINEELKKRQGGKGRGERQKIEADKIDITSGVRFGKTIGSPLTLEIKNNDWENWSKIMSTNPKDESDEKSFTIPRPGHADLTGAIKYNHSDLRNVLERASARKTAIEVAVGAVAQLFLREFGIIGYSNVLQIGKETNEELFDREIENAKNNNDTIGGKIEVIYKNLPIGLGSYVHYDRMLDGKLAQAVMSIPAIRSLSIGDGEDACEAYGSEFHDEIFVEDGKVFRNTNHAGGVEGGMTNGEDLIIRAVMKPIPTVKKSLNSIDIKTLESAKAHFERSDTCAVEACAIVAKNRVASVLADEFLAKFGGDSIDEIKSRIN